MTIGRGLAAGLLAAGLLVSPAMAAAPKPWGDVLVNPQGTGRWLRAESDHVIVYTDEGPEIARRTAEDVEALDRVLRTLYGKLDAPAPRKFPIYLVKAPKRNDIINPDYRRFIPDAMITAVSVDVAEPDDIFAVVVRDSFHFHRVVDQTLGDDGVLGAYALHFFSENFPFPQPRWLTKGAGVYYSSIDIRPGYVTIGDVPALFDNALAAKNLDAVRRLIAERDIMADPWAWGYDAQAALLVRYLWSDPDRKARLATYLDKLEAGATDPKAAWTEAFGEPPEALEAGLRAFLDAPAVRTTLPRTEDRPPTIRIRKMPRGADDLILEIQRLKASPSGYVAGLLDYVRKTAARRPGERYSRQAQARAEIVLGDRDKGEQLLTKLLDEDAGNLEALRLMGTSKLYRAAAEPDPERKTALMVSARSYLRRADAEEPNDYQTLFLLAQTMVSGETPSPERLALLRRAVRLAPQVAKIRLVAAAAFLRANDEGTAFQLLKPLSADPNGGVAARQAKALLDMMAKSAERP